MAVVRIGVLGAARITPPALIRPAKLVPETDVVAVAARDVDRARAFAEKHGIDRAHDSYEAVLADPDVDAVYIPLPNGLHGEWMIRAIEAGKHVLCEKPFTANAAEAEEVAEAHRRAGGRTVVMEAFHYRYHPLVARMLGIVGSGEIGTVRRIETTMCIPLLRRGDIRWRLNLAGGSVMDVGCYTIHLLRTLGGAEPVALSARAKRSSPGVDRWLRAHFRLPDGVEGTITCSMFASRLLKLSARVTGDRGVLTVRNPYVPQHYHGISVATGGTRRRERVTKEPTYNFQLRAFVDAVLRGAPVLTGIDDAIANMRVVDAVYEAAGLGKRQPTRRS